MTTLCRRKIFLLPAFYFWGRELIKKSFTLFFALTCLFLCSSCSDYIVRNHGKNVRKLQRAEAYTNESVSFKMMNLVDENRAAEIRSYFKQNANLDLDSLMVSDKSTWEKTLELAVFVAENVPHDNQKEWLQERNAISLWEYSRRIGTGFNCRWHSTLLSELLLSVGIKNRFVTCLPEDKKDGDCHVVNIVWLPELNKWAMIDSDMTEYAVDENGIPLSLREMRRLVIEGKPLDIQVLPGFEDSWVAQDSGKKYMNAYWAKNLYWFAAHTSYGFDLEGARTLTDSYVALIPPGYETASDQYDFETSNETAFWD